MLNVPLHFENGFAIDALVDSGAYVSAIVQKELDRIKQQAPSNMLKIDEPPNFQTQVGNGQLEKPIATATLWHCRSHLCRTLCCDEESDRTHYRVALHETQQCGHWYHTWPHPLPTFDNASQKCIKSNKCWTPSCSHPWQYNNTKNYNKSNYSSCWPPIGIENNRDRDSSGKIQRNRESDNIPFHVNNNWQNDSNQSNQHNGITLYNQQKQTNCQFLRNHSRAVQVYWTSGHGNSLYDFWRWPRPDYLLDWATRKE